jgi:aarF domain-containing kinase
VGIFDEINNLVKSGKRVFDITKSLSGGGAKLIYEIITKKDINGAEHLRMLFESLGATYIKLGQLIASAPGLFPEAYVKEMQKCLDNVAPLPYSEIQKVISSEFKGKENEIFQSIDENPIASASIAQVHGARLKSGADVVIKVQRPGIKDKLNFDLNLLYFASVLIDTFTPKVFQTGLKGIVKEFHRTLMEEVDFFKEAKNMDEFNDFLGKIEEEEVVVPKVYHEYSTLKILTMERFHGVSLIDLDSIKKIVSDPEATLIKALDTWMQSLLFCGFFHADVHAGNLMVLNNGKIGFIDFGIIGRMDDVTWKALIKLLQALSISDYTLLAESLIEMNAAEKEVNVEKFSLQLKELFKDFDLMGFDLLSDRELDESKMNDLLTKMIRISEDNGLRIPREFVLLFKQILYFDRYIRLLAPGLDIMNSEKINIQRELIH